MKIEEEYRALDLHIHFWRVFDHDKTGSFDITASGLQEWMVADLGPGIGCQCGPNTDEDKVTEFSIKVAALVREYFGDIPSMLGATRTGKW